MASGEDDDVETQVELGEETKVAEPKALSWLAAGTVHASPITTVAASALAQSGFIMSYVGDAGKFEYGWIAACRGGFDAVVVDSAMVPKVWVTPIGLPAGTVGVFLESGISDEDAENFKEAEGWDAVVGSVEAVVKYLTGRIIPSLAELEAGGPAAASETAVDASLLHPAVAASLKGAQADATLSMADRLVASAKAQVRLLQAALAQSSLLEMHAVASGFDYDGSGVLGPWEFERALEDMGVNLSVVKRADIAHLISVCDTGGDGIEFSEFLRALKDIELPEDDDEHGDDSVPKPKM